MKNIYFSLIAIFIFCNTGFLKATDYYLKTSGNAHLAASWGTTAAGNGSGDQPANFSGAHTWHFTNRATLNMSSGGFATPSTAIVVIESAISVSITSLGTLGSASIHVASGGTLTLTRNIAYNLINNNVSGTVVYNNINLVVAPITFSNLVVASSTSLSSVADTHIEGTLTLNTGRSLTLDGGGAVLYLSSVAGSGSLSSNSTALLSFSVGNGGNNGTLNFASTSNSINVFSLDYNTTSDFITLGTPLTVVGGGFFTQNSGGLSLNGQTLTIDNTSDISFDGVSPIKATGNSAINIEGTVGANNSNVMMMDATNNSIRSFTLNSPGSTLQLGSALNITDNLDVTDGTFDSNGFLTLKADATRSARLGPVGATGAITGNASVETFAPGGSTGWTNMGVTGVQNQTINNWQNNPIPMTCNGCLYDPSSVGGFASIQGWSEAANNYIEPLNATDPIDPGVGFWVFLGNGQSSTSALTWTFTGPLQTGNVQVPISFNTSGFNLVANPYASPISWDAVFAHNTSFVTPATSGVIYVYNPDLGVTTTYDANTGIFSHPSTTGANTVIPAGQAFYFELTDIFDPITLDFFESDKISNNTSSNPLLRGANEQAQKEPNQLVRLKLAGSLDGDMTVFNIRENSSFTKGFGDAYKILQTPGYQGIPGAYSKYTTISSKALSGEDLSINTFPPTSYSTAIPVLVRVSTTGTYTISAQDFENYPSCIVIKDKLSGALTDLKKDSYTFFISDTTSVPRFELVVCESGSGPLAINEALEANNSVLISQNKSGAFVKTNFTQTTKATISVFNVIGQQLMPNIQVEGTETTTPINFETKEQVIIVKVTTDKEVITKKIVVH